MRNPPRPGKKLLVLDIDYTLFDHRSVAETPLELQRPCEWFRESPQLLRNFFDFYSERRMQDFENWSVAETPLELQRPCEGFLSSGSLFKC
jgi:hypothetical protein